MAHLPSVGGDHVGGYGQAGRLAKFGHDLPAGEPFLGATGVLGVGEDVLLAAAQTHGLLQGPPPLGSRVTRALGKRSARALAVGNDNYHSFSGGSYFSRLFWVLSARFFGVFLGWFSAFASGVSSVLNCCRCR